MVILDTIVPLWVLKGALTGGVRFVVLGERSTTVPAVSLKVALWRLLLCKFEIEGWIARA